MSKNDGRLERAAETGGLAAGIGGTVGLLGGSAKGLGGGALAKFVAKRAGLAGLIGAGGQAAGDAIMGVPKEHGYAGEFGRGAVGGALAGGAVGVGSGMFQKGGAGLVHYLISKGMSKNKAIAAILGGSALGGGLMGAFDTGTNAMMLHAGEEE